MRGFHGLSNLTGRRTNSQYQPPPYIKSIFLLFSTILVLK